MARTINLGMGALAAATLLWLAVACGDSTPRRADDVPDFAPCSGLVPTSTPPATFPPRVYAAPPTLDPAVPTATIAVPTDTPIPTDTPPPPATPLATATLIPPDPRFVTPRPTSPPYTPRWRPRTPTADDIKLDTGGCYYAYVDGCLWLEWRRFDEPSLGGRTAGLSTPCLPLEGIHFNLDTGEVQHFVLEWRRFDEPSLGGRTAGLSTPCLTLEGIHFNPDTGEVQHFVS